MNEEASTPEEEPLDDLTATSQSGLATRFALDALDEQIPADEARAFLNKQSRLTDEQMHFLRLRKKYYAEDLGIKRLENILKVTVQVLLILTGVLIVAGLAILVWWASRSETVVVEDFDSPPAMAQRGVTGRVVAAGLLDELTKLQSATRSTTAHKSLTSAWSGDIKIEIPDTGVSLGELERTLRQNLGNDVHISGSLVQAQDGTLGLTVRGDDVLPKTFTGTDLAKLTRDAAEYTYGEAEPFLYAKYLLNAGRYGETVSFLEKAYPRASETDRPMLANIWGVAISSEGQYQEAVKKYRLAISLRPHLWAAWANLVGTLAITEGEESSYRAATEMLKIAKASPANDQPKPTVAQNIDILVQDWQKNRSDGEWDAQYFNGAGVSNIPAGASLVDASAMLHDWQAAEKYLAASDPTESTVKAEALLLSAYRALDHRDYASAVAPLEAFYKQWLADPNVQYGDYDNDCLLGLAYAMTGRTAEAEAVFARGGRWVRCYAMHADAIDHSGNWPAAVAAYRSAIALAPSLPYAYDHWGLALERHGDFHGAEAAFREANKRGPHWAEPLKHWGDVLMQENRPQEAAAKYTEALKYAPQWTELQAARAHATHG
jgi:tetratricopeptide (TPR) repeat protein